MTETLYVDPAHRIPDEDWGAVVRRAEEIAKDAAANRTGGAAPLAGPVVDMRGRSNKHSGVSGIATQLLVLHSAECPLMPGYAQSLTEWAITSTVVASWHRFIGPDSRVYMIPDHLAAWHASEANPMSVGWEQAGYARYSRAEWLTPNGLLQLDSLAYDMAQVALAEGIPARWLTTDEVTAVTTFGNRAIKGFCLHRQIDPETRTDPGDGYPYDLLMDRIRGFMGLTPLGTITLSEEDEMAILDEPIIREGGGPLNGQPTTLRAVIANFDANIHYTREAVKATVAATVEALLTTQVARQGGAEGVTDLASTLAYLDANLNKLDAKELLDPESIKSAVGDATRESLKDFTITLSAAPGNASDGAQ